MIGVAFIGAGMVAELHQQALSASAEMTLIGVYDADPARSKERAATWTVSAFESIEAVLADSRVGAVYVLTPAESHVSIALRCLEAGKHVFIEKPVSTHADDIDGLMQAGKRAGRVVMPGHNYTYIPEFLRIVRLVRGEHLGTIRSIWITYAIKHPEAVAMVYGGVLGEVMIHHSYLALAVLGKPDLVYAGVTVPDWAKHPVEDQAWMTWQYPRGITAHLFASFAVDDDSADPWTFVVKVLGTAGSASMTWRSSIFKRPLGTLSFAVPAYEESYGAEAAMFASAINKGSPLISTLDDAATSARITDAAYEAAKNSCAVRRNSGDKSRW